jgi:hypothetical protein
LKFGGIVEIAIAASEKFLEAIKYDGLPVNKPIIPDELNRLPKLAPLEDPDALIGDDGILLSDKADGIFAGEFVVEELSTPTTDIVVDSVHVEAWPKLSNSTFWGCSTFKTVIFSLPSMRITLSDKADDLGETRTRAFFRGTQTSRCLLFDAKRSSISGIGHVDSPRFGQS